MTNKKPSLKIESARENNLKSISLEIPHNQLTVITGLSGSGKSSLAFDTVYAEGQRRYIETFSPYTRQFFDKVKKPDADSFKNVRPAIAIQQRNRITNSRSTVGSLTNINDYLKIIWFNLSNPTCFNCDIELLSHNPSSVADWIELQAGINASGYCIISAILQHREKEVLKTKQAKKPAKHKETNPLKLKESLLSAGFSRFFNEQTQRIEQIESLQNLPERLLLVLDRLRFDSLPANKQIKDSLSQAFNLQIPNLPLSYKIVSGCAVIESSCRQIGYKALLSVESLSGKNIKASEFTVQEFYSDYRCPKNACELPKLRQSLFSFNHPLGACPECKGFGHVLKLNLDKVIPNKNLSLAEKAIQCWGNPGTKIETKELLAFCKQENIPVDLPWKDLSKEQQDKILHSKSKNFWGIYTWFTWLERKAYKMHVRVLLSRYRSQFVCPECSGARLVREALAFKVSKKTLPDCWKMPISELNLWLVKIKNEYKQTAKWSRAIEEVFSALLARLNYLCDLGLPYLTLDRQARTLSGGETQRVNLAAALGSELVSTQFVLDEPSVGLHARDTERLTQAIKKLAANGNSLLVVEHDFDCIKSADNIIEMGPKAGSHGGEVVFNGPTADWPGIELGDSPAGSLLSAAKTKKAAKYLKIKKARARNLKTFDLDIPLEQFVCICGPSGSGKSSLINEVILKAYQDLRLANQPGGKENLVCGFEQTAQVLIVDQSPLTKSPRANIATYSGIWDTVRKLLASGESAQSRGLDKSSFSFNVDGGRCSECKGSGFIREDMQFLSDVYVPCETCLGQRFKPVVLEVTYNNKSVAEILKLSVSDAIDFFKAEPAIAEICETLALLGLEHLSLGHSLSELSGGEAQRLKLVPFVQQARDSGKKSNLGSLLIFDEPTTGLHYKDILRLIQLMKLLRDKGNSILCIEHNLTLLAASDYLIDLGPEGGEAGGYLLWQGHPSGFLEKAALKASVTARFLSAYAEQVSKKHRLNIDPVCLPAEAISCAAEPDCLKIRGAREHNLKNIDISLPYNKMVAFCGVSGSGKSSIAKDIIYAEGQRRYLDCLSPYARQFIKELKKPEIDEIKNVKPTVCVYQHTFQPSRLSTVATMSEIYNFLRLLFVKLARQYCPEHPQHEIAAMSPADMAKELRALNSNSVRLLAPVVKLKKGTHKAVFERARQLEISQLRVDGIFLSASDVDISSGLAKSKAHSVDYVIAKFNPKTIPADLLEESIAQGLLLGSGTILAHYDNKDRILSSERACPVCKKGFFKPDPEDLSFNSKRGRCHSCHGKGLDEKNRVCPQCSGSRLNPIGSSLKLSELTIDRVSAFNPKQLTEFLSALKFANSSLEKLATPILREILQKSRMLCEMGLDYLSLSRDCFSLSAGELQRLRLASAASSSLSGALFIFDEPSAGLHPKDNEHVISCLRNLCDQQNSVIIIEHDQDSILACDHIIEVGPGGGRDGGLVVFSGSSTDFMQNAGSPSARAFRETHKIISDTDFKAKAFLSVKDANYNYIKNLNLKIPLNSLVCIAGVSGAGKSSLLRGIILDCLLNGKSREGSLLSSRASIHTDFEINKVVEVDQKPIGINSRSTPASYLKIWDEIRVLLSKTIEAEVRGWSAGYFSYNSGKGRCPSCAGLGQQKLEMSFLPDARVECDNCEGKRFSDQALSVKYLGLNPFEILSLTFEEAKSVFSNHPKIQRICQLACELGLGYLTLGQSSNTLSGGESQRIKLVSELSSPSRGHCLYILDEPTTGLHKCDVSRLLKILRKLVSAGHSVFIIEHEVELIISSDWVIEMGPGPAERGGKVMYSGRPDGLCTTDSAWGARLSKFSS